MPMFIKTNVPGPTATYKQVSSTGFFAKPRFGFSGLDSYYEIRSGYVKTADGYQQFYQGAVARTYTFNASGSATVSGGTFTLSTLRQGLFYNLESSYTNFGIIQFFRDTQGISLSQVLETRPVVQAATLYLSRAAAPDGFDNITSAGNTYVGRYGINVFSGGHNATYADYTATETAAFSGITIPSGGNSLISVPFTTAASTLVNHLATGLPIFFSNKSNITDLTTLYDPEQYDPDYFWTPAYTQPFTAALSVTLAYA